MQYSDHARTQMTDRNFAMADIEAVIADPSRGVFLPSARNRKESR